MKNNNIEIIKKQELELLKPEVRKNIKRLSELLDSNFLEFTATGFITDKKDVLKRLPKLEPMKWEAINLKVKFLSEDIALVTYKVNKILPKNKKAYWSLRSSVWKNTNGKWKMVFHQGTSIKNKS